MSSNYNCERFAEGKSRVGKKKKKTEKRAERTGNEQRAQGEKKTKKHKKGRRGWKVASPGLLPRKLSTHKHTHTPCIYDCEKALQQPAVIIWWLFNLFYSRIPVTTLTPGQAKRPEGVCLGLKKKKKKNYTINSTLVVAQLSFFFISPLHRVWYSGCVNDKEK